MALATYLRGNAARLTRHTSAEHSNRYYERHAAAYAERTLDAPVPPLLDSFVSLMPRGGRVTDLGCGAGRDLARLVKAELDATGCDLSPALATIARTRSGADVVAADMRSLDLSPASLDGVIAVGSLLHLADSEVAAQLARIASWLKPGGLFLATMKIGSGIEQDRDGRTYNLVQPAHWQDNLLQTGFELVAEDRSSPSANVSSSPHRWIATLARKPA